MKIVHFADPLCWWSWGLEPVLRRLKEVYGDNLEIEYRMGGTFGNYTDWLKEYGVDDRSAVDWIRDSIAMTRNPVDPEYLSKTGVRSTYPACLAFKAAQLQGEQKAHRYFRRLMEAHQVRSAPWSREMLLQVAKTVGLDAEKLSKDMDTREVEASFLEDMHAMHHEGVNFLSLVVEAGGQRAVQSQVFSAHPFEEIIDRAPPVCRNAAPRTSSNTSTSTRGIYSRRMRLERFSGLWMKMRKVGFRSWRRTVS